MNKSLSFQDEVYTDNHIATIGVDFVSICLFEYYARIAYVKQNAKNISIFWDVLPCWFYHTDDVNFPDRKVHGTNTGPTWVLSAPGEPHIGLKNLAIWVAAWFASCTDISYRFKWYNNHNKLLRFIVFNGIYLASF